MPVPSVVDALFDQHTHPTDGVVARRVARDLDQAHEDALRRADGSAIRIEAQRLAARTWLRAHPVAVGALCAIIAVGALVCLLLGVGWWLLDAPVFLAATAGVICAFDAWVARKCLVEKLDEALTSTHRIGGYELLSAAVSATEFFSAAESRNSVGYAVGQGAFDALNSALPLRAVLAINHLASGLTLNHALPVVLQADLLGSLDVDRLNYLSDNTPTHSDQWGYGLGRDVDYGDAYGIWLCEWRTAYAEAAARVMRTRLDRETTTQIVVDLERHYAALIPRSTRALMDNHARSWADRFLGRRRSEYRPEPSSNAALLDSMAGFGRRLNGGGDCCGLSQ